MQRGGQAVRRRIPGDDAPRTGGSIVAALPEDRVGDPGGVEARLQATGRIRSDDQRQCRGERHALRAVQRGQIGGGAVRSSVHVQIPDGTHEVRQRVLPGRGDTELHHDR